MLHPFRQCWTSFVAGAVMLKPKLTQEKTRVNMKHMPQSQLCHACGATLLCFWNQSLQRAVALAVAGLLSVHLS